MRLTSTLSLALRRLGRRPVRSFLLLQGTVWGVAVAIFPSAVIEGTREAARVEGARLGADRIAIVADPTAQRATAFDAADVDALRRAVREGGDATAEVGGAEVLALPTGGADEPTRPAVLVGGTPEVPRTRGLTLARGRWLDPRQDDAGACVVEADVGRWLGRERLDPGDTFRLPGDGEELHVVGVTQARSDVLRRTNDLGFDVTHPLYDKVGRNLLLALGIPLVQDDWKRSDRAVYVLPRRGAVDWIFLRVTTPRVKEVADVAARALVARGRSPVTFHPLVLPLVMGETIDRFQAVQAALFLACLAMGAVVMANLGLLTVLRRGREIAIRRTEGATRADIATHFVLEGLILTALGCALGCVLGMGLAALRVSVEPVTGFQWVFPWANAGIAVGVALVVGVLASLLPALRASRQEPVEGLADE